MLELQTYLYTVAPFWGIKYKWMIGYSAVFLASCVLLHH
uniref:Uncharacterized protein n=1 Tax=Anguilla anguilla TaxID=7936 RepID=A0A0E9SK78_ANGAN